MRFPDKFVWLGTMIFAGSLAISTTVQAATISVEFSGQTTSNPGLLGAGTFSGSITYDTTSATNPGGAVFNNVFSNINFTTGTGSVKSQGTPTTDRLTQVQLVTAEDAFLSNYAGAFGPTGVPGVDVESTSLELRTVDDGDFFGSTSALFGSLADGDVLTLGAEIGFVSLVVRYVGDSSSGSTILRANAFDTLTLTVTGDAPIPNVPLPASAPLVVGALAFLGYSGRRKSRR